MSRPLPTSSALSLVHNCAASWAIPHGYTDTSASSAMGDACHEHHDHRCKYGIDEAMIRAPGVAEKHGLSEKDTEIFLALCRNFTWVPPKGSFGEVSLALLDDGNVVRVEGGKGQYKLPENTVTAGTLDAMWAEPMPLDLTDPAHPKCPQGSALWVVDIKSGQEQYVERIEENSQAKTNALMAARWTGATHVVPAILFMRSGPGVWDVPETTMGPAELRKHEMTVFSWIQSVREQQRRHAAGEPLDLHKGPWCEFCPARSRCSAHTGLVRMVATGELSPIGDAPLTPATRKWLAEHLNMLDRFVKEARETLKRDVRVNGEIPMSNGNVWGPKKTVDKTIIVPRTLEILREELGAERAEAVVQQKITLDGIKDAVKEKLAAEGVTRAGEPTFRRILAKLYEASAIVEREGVEYGAHKP